MLGRARQVLARAVDFTRLLEVLGRHGQKVVRTRAGLACEPGAGLGVVAAAQALEHRVVRDLVQHLVAERELARTTEAGFCVRHHQRALRHSGQRGAGLRVDGGERQVPEHKADDGRLLQRQLLGGLGRVEPGLQHAGEGLRHMGDPQLVGVQRPAARLHGDGPFIDQHLHQLFHVERVAFGRAGDEFTQRLGNLGQLVQQLVGQKVAHRVSQRLQVDAQRAGAARPVAAALVQRRAREPHHQQRHIEVHVAQVLQEVERAVVGPVQVFKQHQQRLATAPRDLAHHLLGCVEGAAAQLPAVALDAGDVRALCKVEPDQVAEQVDGCVGRRVVRGSRVAQRCHAALEAVLGFIHAVAITDLEAPGQHVAQQAVRLVARLRVGAALEQLEATRVLLGPDLEFVQQAALAHAGFADNAHAHEPVATPRLRKGLLQALEFSLAPDHLRGHALDAARGGAKGARPSAQHKVGDDTHIDTLHLDRRLQLHVEHAAHMGEGVVGDAQLSDRRRLLHARRHIHSRAANAVLGIDPAAQQHAAGVHAHAHVEAAVAVACLHHGAVACAFGKQVQAGAHRALGIVFLRLFGTEHGQQAVAGVLQHLALMRGDDGGAGAEQ